MSISKIKSMKLYQNVDRIFNELKAINKDKSKSLNVHDLFKFDQLHYNGTKAVDFAIKKTKINKNKLVLEIGSGIGGPARYIGYKTKSLVTALELQKDQNKVAKILTKKCNLTEYIKHIEGDILKYKWREKTFDVVVSWLTLYHIKKHNELLTKCHKIIKDDGLFFAEDIIAEKKLNNEDLLYLSKELFANYLPTYNQYLLDLEKSGFKILYHKNMGNNWSKFVNKRKKNYDKDRKRHIRVHGKKIFENVSHFYKVVDKFFKSKKIGGIKIIAKKLN